MNTATAHVQTVDEQAITHLSYLRGQFSDIAGKQNLFNSGHVWTVDPDLDTSKENPSFSLEIRYLNSSPSQHLGSIANKVVERYTFTGQGDQVQIESNYDMQFEGAGIVDSSDDITGKSGLGCWSAWVNADQAIVTLRRNLESLTTSGKISNTPMLPALQRN